MEELISPKQVALAMGVSESSLKRWCDKGLIPTVRTSGGHRKLPIAAVLNFMRQQGKELVRPDLLGLPVISRANISSLQRATEQLRQAFLQNDIEIARRTVFDMHLAGHTVALISDHVICPAFQLLGSGWESGEVAIYQERRACDMTIQLLHELRMVLPTPTPNAPLAIGGSLAGDHYQLPTQMIELTLRQLGWNAHSLGINIPAETWQQALRAQRPACCWISVSSIADETTWVAEFNQLAAVASELHIPLMIGGRALTAELRQQINFTAYYETIGQMLNFAVNLLHHQQAMTKKMVRPSAN